MNHFKFNYIFFVVLSKFTITSLNLIMVGFLLCSCIQLIKVLTAFHESLDEVLI